MNKVEFTIGSDPEFFIWDRKCRVFVPPVGMTEGTKKEPEPLWDEWCVQIDGFALEFNTPAYKVSDVKGSVLKRIVNDFNDNLPKFHKIINERLGETDRYLISTKCSSTVFSKDVWEDSPDYNKRLGCDPDYDCWTGKPNVVNEPEERFRTCSGHISLGWHNEGTSDFGFEVCCTLAQEFSNEVCLGKWGILDDEEDLKRTRLYGKPGCFRQKPFGIEFRQPSNRWYSSSKLRKQYWSALEKIMGWANG